MLDSTIFNRFLSFLCIVLFSTFLTAPGNATEIVLKPVSIRHGIESQISLNWPLKDKNQIFRSEYFKEPQRLAKKAGINITEMLDQPAIAGFSSTNQNFFQLFYNTAYAPSCKREYLIQRVKITKSHYDNNHRLYKQTHEYLVEAMKTKNSTYKRADRHIRSYSINDASRRSTIIEAEIGCGTLPNEATGNRWPYSKGILYKEIQGYQPTPGVYNKIKFDFSKRYSFGVEFHETGIKSITWPYFIK